MRLLFLTGVSALALASTPALAQDAAIEEPTEIAPSGELDTLVEGDVPTVAAAPAATGDPVLDRLNALEAKIAALEARNKQLEDQAEFNEGRIEKVEVRSVKSVQTGIAPTFADVGDNFTFKPRGTLQLDYAAYNERAGGYDYSNGTAIRRGRFGFDGTAFKKFKWRLEGEFVGQQANLLDAYVSYTGVKNWVFTVGQQKAPYGLEANTSDSFNTFLERGMASNAFGAVGAERRIGITAAYQTDKINGAVGVFGSPENVTRANSGPDEGYGVNGRLTWDPVLDTGKVVHIGGSAYWVTNLRSGTTTDAVRLSERSNSRVDGGLIIDTGVIPNAKDATFLGAEAAIVRGPFSLQGEYGRLKVARTAGLPSVDFDGFYVFGSVFLTGESRAFKNGTVDRQKPFKDFNPAKGGWGAFELALRYDQLDVSDTPVLARAGNQAESVTAALNWYLNPNLKLLLNYIRFSGDNTPLDPIGAKTKGDVLATRLHLDF